MLSTCLVLSRGYSDFKEFNKNFSSKKKGNMNNQDVQIKKDILLHAYKCTRDQILSNLKISYEIGFGTVTAIILIVGYSFSSNQLMLLSVIPFIFIAGATIYYHAIMGAFIGARYNLEIETKIKDLTKLNLLDIEQKIGVFGERSSYPHFHEIPLGIFFLLGYLVSIATGTYFIWIENNKYGLIILMVYLVASVFFGIFGYQGIKYMQQQRMELKKFLISESACSKSNNH